MRRVIYYESTEQVSLAMCQSVDQMAARICSRHAWSDACEPVTLQPWPCGCVSSRVTGESEVVDRSGRLSPATDAKPSLPAGDLPQLISALCELSTAYNLTFELHWSGDLKPAGKIERGRCDAGVFDHVLGQSDEQDPALLEPIEAAKPDQDWKQMRLADTLVDTWTGADLSRIGIQLSELQEPENATIPIAHYRTVDVDPHSDEDDGAAGFDDPAILPFPG